MPKLKREKNHDDNHEWREVSFARSFSNRRKYLLRESGGELTLGKSQKSKLVAAEHSLTACDVSRDGQPLAVALCPHVGVAARCGPSVWHGVSGSRVNNRDVTQDPHLDVVGLEAGDLPGPPCVLQEPFPFL